MTRAATLAKEHGASLIVLVVVNTNLMAFTPMAPPVPQEVFRDLIKNGEDMLAQAIKIAQSIIPQVAGSLEEGNAGDCLLDFAANAGVDIIVLGRRGISGVERFLLGGVSSNIIDHSKCDALIVR